MFGVGALTFVLAFALGLIKCCRVAINVAGLPNVRETLLQNHEYKWISLSANFLSSISLIHNCKIVLPKRPNF